MNGKSHQKVTPQHLTRDAYLYVRQSTLRQVAEHTESSRRQYDLQLRAFELGWGKDQLIVVDCDQGQSGSSADRVGFQKLVSEVGLGRAGIVMGLEVSRLARNSADWHRLLEICGLTNTLILDEEGLYNPSHFNDRLLLGLKGTMSEAELYMLRSRLHGGLVNKAQRGELIFALPIGFVYDEQCQVILDPDIQVQESIRALFATFLRVGSAVGTARAFRREMILFPRRPPVRGPHSKSPVTWRELDVSTVVRILQNPRYAGIYCYGRTHREKAPQGHSVCHKRAAQDWHAWIPDAHVGYISQQEFEENNRRLAQNAQAIGADRRSPPRDGPALLQGIVLCGKCGRRMQTRYHTRADKSQVPSYVCLRLTEAICQSIHGARVDKALGELLVELMTPMSLEVSLSVQKEIEQRSEQTERLRRRQVERVRYEADLARQRFFQVDPNNRLVAANLETEWDEKLKLLATAEHEFERWCEKDSFVDAEQLSKITCLVADFSQLWNDPSTPARERKRMVRLLVEDVALRREGHQVHVQVRFKGGATRTLTLAVPRTAAELYRAEPEVIREIDRLLDHNTESEIADLFNNRGLVPSRGGTFTLPTVRNIRLCYKLKCRFDRLRDRGLLRARELGKKLGVQRQTIGLWRRHGLLKVHFYGDRRFLYEDLTQEPSTTPAQIRDRLWIAFKQRSDQSNRNEVQYEA